MNTLTVNGKLKNVRKYKNERGILMTAQLTQRDEYDRAVFTMPIVVLDSTAQKVMEQLDSARGSEDGYTAAVKVTGSLATLFDRTPNKDMSERKAPFTRILAQQIELV